jgi:putative ATPase
MDIFEYSAHKAHEALRPLAERMRPERFSGFVGQPHITGKDALIRNAIEKDRIFSMILWGPPGSGKTTLARIVANETSSYFVEFSAVLSGVKQIRAVIDDAKYQLKTFHKKTILFVDEIHRFNKAQQDAFLLHVENGLITLIGATTENPSFEVITPLMSRCRVITLNPLLPEDLAAILQNAIKEKKGLGNHKLKLTSEGLAHIIETSEGDARVALNGLELISEMVLYEKSGPAERQENIITLQKVEQGLQRKSSSYDKDGESHFNLISAFHKSMRGTDPDAAIYWLCRMLSSGEDRFYILRRMIRFASEDVGNADPNALNIALNAMEAYRFLGTPEGELAIVQAVLYLSTAPKSNSSYAAYNKVKQVIEDSGSLPVPLHIRNAPTQLMKHLGYGKNYKYPHDFKGAYIEQTYLPEKLEGSVFYEPCDRGYEQVIRKRLRR